MVLPPGSAVVDPIAEQAPTRTFVTTPPPAAAPAPGGDSSTPEPTATDPAQEVVNALSGPQGAADGATGIPVTALAAYKKAEAILAAAKPSCHLTWWLVASIGRIETGHAFGGRLDANGNTRGQIMGPLLDGSIPGTAVIRDTDGGKWDGNAQFDAGVGPMGFLPGSWAYWGKDGNGDGVANPNNIFDAATAAGYVLCSAGDLSNPATLYTAILQYNHSDSYVQTVLKWAAAYRDGGTPAPDSTASVPATPVTPTVTPPPAPSTTAAPASSPSTTTPPKPTTSTTSSTTTTPPKPTTTTSPPTTTTAPPTTTSTTTPPPTTTTAVPTTTTTTQPDPTTTSGT
jgi:membrane-bound lytic murein transglycosylase B